MRALVTGAAGFIGSTLSTRLLEAGWTVTGVDALTDYYDVTTKNRHLGELSRNPAFTSVLGDLNDLALAPLLDGVDVVFHLAGQPGVRSSWGEQFDRYTHHNVNATQRLLEAARGRGSLSRFVYASSSSVYGNALRYPVVETDVPRPVSPYGVTKLAAEHLSHLYGDVFGVPTVALRYFTVYGPRQRPDMAFTRFVRAALAGEEITIYGDGEQVRDFTFVEDVVEATIAAGTRDVQAGSVYNVAGGSSTTVNETLELVAELANAELRISRLAPVPGDAERTGADTSRIRDELGWAPQVALRDGLARQVEWARSAFPLALDHSA